MQEILVIACVSIAVFFVGKLIYKQFFAKETKCESCAIGKMTNEER